jgi:hypothetical protein
LGLLWPCPKIQRSDWKGCSKALAYWASSFVSDEGEKFYNIDTSTISSDDESLKKFAELLQISEQQMRKWLCNRKIVTARESYDTPMNAKAVRLTRIR